MKSSKDTIGDRTRYRPPCIAVPQPLRHHVPATVRHKFIVDIKNIAVHLTLYCLYIQGSAAVRREQRCVANCLAATVELARRWPETAETGCKQIYCNKLLKLDKNKCICCAIGHDCSSVHLVAIL
jgi:hypothetical protein